MKLQKKAIHRNSRLRTMHACLIAMGANPKKVYAYGKNSFGREQGTLYDRYSYEDLLEWLDKLKSEALKWHPDLHPEDREFYSNKMAEINAAYQRGKHILTNKENCYGRYTR